jgi:putative ABC transport system permease protein
MYSVFGRLSDAATAEVARRELGGDTLGVRASFGWYPEFQRRDEPFFRLLGGAVSLLLLLACANVAVLFLLRAASRRQELAARVALGASRRVLARQLLVEGTLVAAAACLLGGIAADVLVRRSATLTARFGDVTFGVDLRVLAFAAAAAALTTVLVSVLPVLRLGRVAPMQALRSASAGGVRGVSPAQRALVVFQVAVSLTLVATATMIVETMQRLLGEDAGFDPTNVAMVYFEPRGDGWDEARMRQAVDAVQAAADRHPELAAATLATSAPLLGRSNSPLVYRDGEAPAPSAPGADELPPGGTRVRFAAVAPGYFGVLGIPLASGREFIRDDGPGAPPAAVVSRRLARHLWGDENAVGRHLAIGRGNEPALRVRVVGVVADHKHASLTESDALVLWVSIFQSPPDGTMLIARGRSDVPSREVLTGILAEADPEIFPDAVWTMEGLMSGWLDTQRSVSTWIGIAGALALFLAALGVYGVVGHVARERVRELAVRSALGAMPRQLTVLLMGEGIRLAAVGGVAGAVLLFWTQSIVRRSLEGMSGVDLPIVGGCVVLLLAAMSVSSFLPARRVARISPVEVLREE